MNRQRSMKAMALPRVVALADCPTPLQMVDLPLPQPGPGQIRVRVAACGVCHTELDEIEGRTAPSHWPAILGHEVVGYVDQLGPGVGRWQPGDRVGVGWIHRSTGDPQENFSSQFVATGRDVPGGYAQFMLADANYVFAMPNGFSDVEAAPLLCAGAIGYRALRLTQLSDGQPLGLTGFGASAHLVLQLARFLFPRSDIFVFARDQAQRDFARELGATWAGEIESHSPQRLQAIIDTTPAWRPVVAALANLAPGGRLVINAIRKQPQDQDALLELNYHEHLWLEREIKSVANITAQDIREFLPLAARAGIRVRTTTYHLSDANQAIVELWQGSVRGAKVLVMDEQL
jgi:propanol-preferring alcohol dehydrogenase